MVKEKFILVSLKEEESQKLAQVISNKTSRKILDYLAESDATESELAEKLGLPISTVHYNLQALVKGKLVVAEEYHYSPKGKEVLHYKLANKYIIIAPKSTYGIKEKLKSILPVGLLAVLGTALVDLYSRSFTKLGSVAVSKEAVQAAEPMMEEAVRVGADMAKEKAVMEAAPVAANVAGEVACSGMPIALWFLYGCIFVVLAYIIVEWIRYKKK